MAITPAALLRYGCALLLATWLAGCALQAPVNVSGEPDRALQARLAAIDHWNLDGKLAVRSAQQAESARVQWQQDGAGFDIHLSGPAGLKATRIYGIPGGVRFEQGEHRESAGSAEVLSERLIGWPLPATEMTWWLRGLPATDNDTHTIIYTPEGWLAQLEQGDWTIRFSDHRPVRDVVLPGRIEAVRGELKITLVIKAWELP